MVHVGAGAVLERLRGVEWEMRWDLAFARVGSRRVLMWEYLRRAAVWAGACGAEGVWPFYDVTAYVDPEFELGHGLADSLEELLRGVPGEELRRTCAGPVRLAELRARNPELVAGLPDPYEPIVLFYERGGSFTRDCSGASSTSSVRCTSPGRCRGSSAAGPSVCSVTPCSTRWTPRGGLPTTPPRRVVVRCCGGTGRGPRCSGPG